MIGFRAPVLDGLPSDLRLLPPAAAAWASALLVLLGGARNGPRLLAIACVLVAAAALAVRRRERWAPWFPSVIALLVVVAGVGVIAAARVAAVRPDVVTEMSRGGVSVATELVVASDPMPLRSRWSSDRVRVGARLESVRGPRERVRLRVPVTVFAPGSWRTLLPGTRVTVRGRLAPTTFRDEAALLVVRGPPTVVRGPGRVARAAGALRAGLRDAVGDLGPDPRGLVPGMVLGDTSAVPAQLVADERVAGLTHLTAVSGANVAILLAAVLGAARLLGARKRVLLVVGVLSVVGFVVVARPSPSVLRAAVMGCVALVGVMRGTRGRGVQILAAAVVGLLVVDPWLALSVGFALSVAATGALLVVAPLWRERLARRLPRALAEPLAVASVAHLATVPLIAAVSGRVSLVSVPANLLAEPAVVVVTVTGAAATVLSPASPAAAHWAARPAGWGAAWVAEVAHRSAALPLADVAWPHSPAGLVVLTLLAGVLLVRGAGATWPGGPHRTPVLVGGAWHASRDVSPARVARPGDGRDRPRGPPRRTRRGRGRHRRARPRRRRRRA